MKPVFLVGEAQGENEAKIGAGFVGTTGAELLRMLGDARVITLSPEDRTLISRFYADRDPHCLNAVWQQHPEVYRTNVFQQHPPGNNLAYFCGPKKGSIDGYPSLVKSGYVQARYSYELDRLGDEILGLDPDLIVCLGNSALWALAGRTGITKFRGTTLVSTHTISGYKLLCTYHPAAVTRQWELRATAVADLSKVNREKEFPDVRRPACEIWVEPSIEDIVRFITEYIRPAELVAVDIETSGQQITCIGFAPRREIALVVPIYDPRAAGRSYWPTAQLEHQCWKLIRSILEDRKVRKVFQNGLYDIAFLWRAYGIRTFSAVEDTMLLHHALQPESPKRLGYLGSIYTDHGPWKSERKGTETIKRDE